MADLPNWAMEKAREAYNAYADGEWADIRECIAAAIVSERERAAARICSGCRAGHPVNQSGYHEQGSHTFPCHAAALTENGGYHDAA